MRWTLAVWARRKKAIFCVIPVDDSSMNYLVGMLYTQCFQALYRRADEKHNGRLPVPVRVIQDEWANVAQPESYPKILATCRSYNIGLNIIVQNIQQIKALYEKEWEKHHRQLRHAAVPRRRQRADLAGVYRKAAGQGDHRHPHTGGRRRDAAAPALPTSSRRAAT